MNKVPRGPWQTVLRVVTLTALIVSLFQVIAPSAPVRAEDPTAAVQSAAEPTESVAESVPTEESATEPPSAPTEDSPTETPTSEPTVDTPTDEPNDDQPPTDIPTEEPTSTATLEPIDVPATDIPTVTSTPADSPAQSATSAPEVVESATDTATTAPAATSATTDGPSAAAVEDSGVRVTIRANDSGGPGIPNVCLTLVGKGNGWNDSACTDELGQATLHVLLRFEGLQDYRVLIQVPPGYAGNDTLVVAIPPGAMASTTGVLVPVPPVDQTLRAVDAVSNSPVGGACWSYYELQPTILTKGDLLYGPTCDTDNDGATVFAQTPPGSYCVEVTPPTSWRTVTGQKVFCGVDPSRGDGFRVALVTDVPTVSGSVVATIKTAWGTAVPEVCAGAVVSLAGGGLAELGTACSDESGKLKITKLPPGSYALQWRKVSAFFLTFADVPFTIVDTTPVSLTVTLENDGTYDADLNAVAGYGPAPVPGVCWTMKVMDVAAQKPTSTVVVGPICDDDGDGKLVLEDVPSGSFCFTATPPKGWYRPDNSYEFCEENLVGYKGTLGFIPTPAGPKPSPTPSPTPFPTPQPSTDEGKGNLVVQNCAYTGIADGFRFFSICSPVGAGVRFALIQGGQQIATLTTNGGGFISVDLQARTAYTLTYLDGNSADWAPGPGQEAQLRYDAKDGFSFAPSTLVTNWTMKVRTFVGAFGWNRGTPLGGGCYRLVDRDGNVLLPEVCDTDGDGEVILGTQPASSDQFGINIDYRAEMTSPPTGGYQINSFTQFGIVRTDDPTVWEADFQYNPVRLNVRAKDEIGTILTGWCFVVASQLFAECDDDDEGVVALTGFTPGEQVVISVTGGVTPGYLPDTQSQLITIGSDPEQEVVFTAHPYGSTSGSVADARFTITPTNGATPDNLHAVCFSLTSNTGTPSGKLCANVHGQLTYRNLAAGSYTLKLTDNPFAGCETPATFPAVSFTIGSGDLGKVKDIPVTFRCPKPLKSCFVERTVNSRSVDLYVGTLTDDETNAILLNGLQLSESITTFTGTGILDGDNPDPSEITDATLAPWVMDFQSGKTWGEQPDWDNNARQGLLDQFATAGPDGIVIAGEPTLLGQDSVLASIGSDLYFPGTNDPIFDDYPECDEETTGDIFVIIYYNATVNFYELNARLGQPEGPTPTPFPQPDPICSTTVSRTISAFYGTLTDENGDPISTELFLSDHIPPALRDAIAHGGTPQGINALFDDWVDSDYSDDTWGENSPEGLDSEAALTDDYGQAGNDVSIDGPQSAGSETYSYTSYRWIDGSELPSGCFIAAAFAPLYPISQTTEVTIDYTQLNASLGGNPSANPSPTPKPTKTPNPHHGGNTPTASPTEEPVTSLPSTGTSGSGDGGNLSAMLVLLSLITAVIVFGATRIRRT